MFRSSDCSLKNLVGTLPFLSACAALHDHYKLNKIYIVLHFTRGIVPLTYDYLYSSVIV